jgi:hypothetical protein
VNSLEKDESGLIHAGCCSQKKHIPKGNALVRKNDVVALHQRLFSPMGIGGDTKKSTFAVKKIRK